MEKTTFGTRDDYFEFLVMSFGLSNASTIFQFLMNEIFQPYLRTFILVFFDDILIYSKAWDIHWDHLQITLAILEKHCLFFLIRGVSLVKLN